MPKREMSFSNSGSPTQAIRLRKRPWKKLFEPFFRGVAAQAGKV
jgi:hypothetical protein